MMRAWGCILWLIPAAAFAQTVDVTDFVGIADQNGRIELRWTNASLTNGIIIARRAGGVVTWAPPAGPERPVDVNATVGSQPVAGTWVIADVTSVTVMPDAVSTFIDTGAVGGPLVAGTRYHYRIFNTTQVGNSANYRFSGGNVPTHQGIAVWAINPDASMLKWCYSVGLPNLVRPVVSGTGVRTVGQLGKITGNAASNAAELFRPLPLRGPAQARPVTSNAFDGPGGPELMFVGDQAGFAHRFNATTGVKDWERDSNALFGSTTAMPIQASAVAQLQVPGVGSDMVFFASRTGSTNNAVSGMRTNGTRAWLYRPSGLADVVSEMMVDTANNRLWIPTNATTDSLRIISTSTGALIGGPEGMPTSPALGPITGGIVLGDYYRDASGNPVDRVVLVAAHNGIWAFARNSRQYLWHLPLASPPNGHVLPVLRGFYVPFGNSLRRYRWNETDESATPHALYGDVTVSAPTSTARIAQGHVVFSAGNTVYAVGPNQNIVTSYTVPVTGIISPIQEDPTGTSGYFGTMDGRVCKVTP